MPTNVQFTARVDGQVVVWDDPLGKPAKSHQLRVPKGAPPEKIEFRLKDKTGLGLSFDQSDPFQAWEQAGCPPAGVNTDQIEIVQCTPDSLQIVSRNTGPARVLQYQLNVVGADSAPWPCDPIIKNEGGGPGFA